jgi:hypothetical protein
VYTLQELAAEYLHDGIHLSSAGSSVLFEGVLTVLFSELTVAYRTILVSQLALQ